MRRSKLRVIRTAVNDRHDTIQQCPVELFRHVIRAKRIFSGDVKLVVVQQRITVHPVEIQTCQITAFAVNVQLYVFGQFSEVDFTSSITDSIRAEPSDQFGPISQLRVLFLLHYRHRQFEYLPSGYRRRQLINVVLGFDDSVWFWIEYIRVPPMSHGPIEEVALLEVMKISGKRQRFVEQKNVSLVREPVRWNVRGVERYGVKQNTVTLICHPTITGGYAVGHFTSGVHERLLTKPKVEIAGSVVFVPVKQYLGLICLGCL